MVYCIICIKCLKKYIGQTSLPLRRCIHSHIHPAKYTEKKMWSIYRHFHRDSHDFDRDTRIIPLEKCRKKDLLLRETFLVMTLETVVPFGLNSSYTPLLAKTTFTFPSPLLPLHTLSLSLPHMHPPPPPPTHTHTHTHTHTYRLR